MKWKNAQDNPPKRAGKYVCLTWSDTLQEWSLFVADFDPSWTEGWSERVELWAKLQLPINQF